MSHYAHEIQKIGIIGAGLMGHIIAQLFFIKGYSVFIFDNNNQVLEDVQKRIKRNLNVYTEVGTHRAV